MCKRSWRRASSKPAFFFDFFLRSRLGVSFDHICILVMKFAPGPVISVYLTDSHSLRTGAFIGRFKSGLRSCCCRCILLTDNIFDISVLPLVTVCWETSQFSVKHIFQSHFSPRLFFLYKFRYIIFNIFVQDHFSEIFGKCYYRKRIARIKAIYRHSREHHVSNEDWKDRSADTYPRWRRFW